ncbi:MAG: murB [Acidimicrobiia bacterium]|nr:murB [Acidimicrobiia bacterium]
MTSPSGAAAHVTNEAVERAAALLGPLARRNVPLGPRTTYRVGGSAALLVEIDGWSTLRAVGAVVRETGIPTLLVGRGSNLLVADTGFAGLALVLGPWAEQIQIEGRRVTAGGAVSLPVLARRTAAAGLTGLEWAVGIPGSVGGGVHMNAGGHGSDVAASVTEVKVFDLVSGHDAVLSTAELGFAFRSSGLEEHQVVVSATFELKPGDAARSEAELTEIVRWRRQHQPGGQNCGSVFVNPLPRAAGELIDSLGLRGTRLGTAVVSPKHANFIQADEGGQATDVFELMRTVRAEVLNRLGVGLRSELRLVGFDGGWDR